VNLSDAFEMAEARTRDLLPVHSSVDIPGFVTFVLLDGDGARVKAVRWTTNLLTDYGDQYYAAKAITSISPANASAPTAVNGMRLGTSSTAAAKSGTGATIGTVITSSGVPFDTGFPDVVAVGTNLGYYARYQSTWAAGVATSTTINEVALITDYTNTGNSTAANTYARAVVSTLNKSASDILIGLWRHKLVGI